MSQDDHRPGPSRPERGAPERFETVIIGAGQAGLAEGYHLAKRDRPFVILDANERGRRQLAVSLGLDAAVQPGARGRPARDAVPSAADVLSHEG